MSDYITMPVSSVSPMTFCPPLANVDAQSHVASPQHHYKLPNSNPPWPPAVSRFLPSPHVKIEPLEPGVEEHYYYREGYAVGNASSNCHIGSHAYRLPSYHGRMHLQAPSNQVEAAQQLPTFTSHHGHVSNMSPSVQSYYNWQYQLQHAYQSSRSSMPTTMLDYNSSTDSVATMAPLDMKPSSPASSLSEGNGYKAMADVSITLYPWTTRVRNATLFTGTTNLSSVGEFGNVQGTSRRSSSPPSASLILSSDDDRILPIEPPVAALSLREIQCQSGTNWSDPLQHESDYDVSDSEDDADHSDDDDAPQEIHYEQEGHDHDHNNDDQRLDQIQGPSDADDLHQHDDYERSDEVDSDNDGSDAEQDHVYAPNQTGNRLASLLDMPAATSNLRSKPTKSVPGSTKLQSPLPVFPITVPQRAAAKVATKRLIALSRPTTPEVQVKLDVNDKVKPKYKVSPPKKRVSRPRAAKKANGKKRPLAVTSAALCRVPAPTVNFNIHKKSRGRPVTTDPNAVDSNIVHVCPVPACGACFKRREHVKRHIRGLHTEDKVSWD